MAVCKVKTILVVTSAILAALVCQTTGANTLYQWTDQSGVITYSPNPPPESSGIEAKVVNLNKSGERKIQDSNTSDNNLRSATKPKASTDSLIVSPSLAATAAKKDLPRDEFETNTEDSIRDETFSARCQDLANRITALESRMTLVDEVQALNKTILLLSRYQKSFDSNCQGR